MALTPEEIFSKRFQATKFRAGYDQNEVDDFLDEIVVEIKNLLAKIDQLEKDLERARAHSGQS